MIAGAAGAWVVRFDGEHPGVAYAGTQSRGLWKSADEGKSWTAQNRGLEDLNVRSVDLQGDLIVVGTRHGVYYSKDAGISWSSLGLQELSIAAVAIVPRSAALAILAGSDDGSVTNGFLLRTQDLTASWTPVRGNFPADAVVSALAVGPLPAGASDRPVLAGTPQGLFRSDDGGGSWTQLAGLPPTDFNVVLFNPANADQIYVGSDGDLGSSGVYRSLDRGSTWSPLGSGLPSHPRVTALALQPANPLAVFAATWNPTAEHAGLYRAEDPSATVLGAPVAVAAQPSPAISPKLTPSPLPKFVPSPRGIGSPSSTLWRDVGVGTAGLLLVAGLLWLRRRYRRRQDRRTYE